MTTPPTLTPTEAADQIHAAELALGHTQHIMADWTFQKRMGWHGYWTPDTPVRLAASRCKSLIWC